MATNNAINLKASGIASYDGAGTFSALASPLTVANGGTSVTSLTAYAVLCGGTTSTNPIQSIAGVGTAGQVLKSNGAGALPTFQAAPTGTQIAYRFSCGAGSPADSTSYFFVIGMNFVQFTTLNASGSYKIVRSGTINTVRGKFHVSGTLGSAQNCTLAIRLNNSSDTSISTTILLNALDTTFSTTTLGLSVAEGDFISLKFTGPAWTTNPTSVSMNCTILLD